METNDQAKALLHMFYIGQMFHFSEQFEKNGFARIHPVKKGRNYFYKDL